MTAAPADSGAPPALVRDDDGGLADALAWLRGRLTRLIDGAGNAARTDGSGESATLTRCVALKTLGERFGLSRFEQSILLLCAAIDLDPAVAPACGLAQGMPERAYPTFALAAALFVEPDWQAFSPQGALRHWRFVEIDVADFQGIMTSRIRIAERILHFLKGLACIDERLAPYVLPVEPSSYGAPHSGHLAVVDRLRALATDRGRRAIELRGSDRRTRSTLAARASREAGLRLLRLAVEDLPTNVMEADALAHLWDRECALQPLALLLTSRAEAAATAAQVALQLFLERSQAIVFLDLGGIAAGTDVPRAVVEIPAATRTEQRAAWQAVLGSDRALQAERLAAAFDLEPGAIASIALGAGGTGRDHDASGLWQGCLAHGRARFGRLAERLASPVGWDDLVLPAPETKLLRQVAAQVAQRTKVYEDWGYGRKTDRGLGISALFCGESGTGKTMAAEVIANELKFDLYRIDLSQVVSKYIGETEKNIREVFDAAEQGGIVLFFDEADALYGRRSEVKDSHDRYANIEISYLLQRMESYRGLSILATNRKNALDPAFLRRLRFVIDFPFPTPAAARALWIRAFPDTAPVADLDLDRLAALGLTGGSIRNIVLNAAFLAAEANGAIDMSTILAAAADELRKLGRHA